MFIAIVDVGHGNATVISDENGVIVVDTGPGSSLLEFLTDEGLSEISTVLVSHADKDHIEGLIGILSSGAVKVKRVCLNSDSEKQSRLWQDLLKALDVAERDQKLQFEVSLTTNQSGKFDAGDIHIQILAPSNYLAARGPGSTDAKNRTLTVHSVCAVVRLVLAGRGIVALPGDIDLVGLDNLTESQQQDLQTDLLVFPHHGGRPGHDDMATFATTMCKLFSPKSVIFSTGRGQHGTPQPEIVSAVKKAVTNVRLLCTQLSERCAKSLPAEPPSHLAKNFARGRLKRKCCAGTIIVDPKSDVPISLPVVEAHQAFIDTATTTPVCRLID